MRLEFANPVFDRTGVTSLDVRLVGSGLDAQTSAYVHLDALPIDKFFRALRDQWRGWEREQSYASLEGELSLTARHVGSHVRVTVAIGGWSRSGGWRSDGVVDIEPGEELSRFADQLDELLRPRR